MLDTILIVVNGPPSETSRKAGLFPVTIRQHLSIARKVLVFSIMDRCGKKSRGASGLGDAIYVNPEISGISTFVGARGNGPFSDLALRDLARLLGNEGIQAVTALQSTPRSGRFAQKIAAQLDLPYFIWEHSSAYGSGRFSPARIAELKSCLLGAAGVAAVSRNLLVDIERVCEIDLDNSTVIPNPVPSDFEFTEAKNARDHKLDSRDGPIFGGWTNWRSLKRLDVLLDAFDIVLGHQPNARLLIAGPVGADEEVRLAHPRISYLGNIGRSEVRQLARTVDVCCVPSDFETFGLPVIEALAEGTPVVCTDCDGPSSIVTEPFLGRIVGRGDVAGFAKAMVDVADSPAEYPDERIRDFAINQFGEWPQIERWKNFYGSVLGAD
jgi:glycosyltransferase involved in cell wall biosynthesis